MTIVTSSYAYYPDPTKGRPVFNGSLYVGLVGLDPEVEGNQQQVTIIQEDGTEVNVSQPVKTNAGGQPTYNGSPVKMKVPSDYSLKVLDRQLAQVSYEANSAEDSSIVTVSPSGSDDTSAIIAAAASLTNGGKLILTSGTYITSAEIATTDNTEVVGCGYVRFDSSITQFNGFAVFQSGNNCKFTHLYASGTDIDEAGYCFISTLGKDNILIEDCHTLGGLGEAFLLQDGDNVTVQNCSAFQTNRWSIYAAKMSNYKILDNHINGSQLYDGIKIASTLYSDPVTQYTNTDGIVRGNTSINNFRDGIDSAAGVDALLIEGNICKGNANNGIEVKLPAGSLLAVQRVKVSGNVCVANDDHGIRFDDVLRSGIIGNITTDNGVMGITVDNNCQEIKVQSNEVYRNASHGIRVQGHVTVGVTQDVDVSSNKCIDNGGVNAYGITLGSYIDDIRVKNNECYQNTTDQQDFGIAIIGTISINRLKIENNYIPEDKNRTGGFSRGSWTGANVYMSGNILHSDTFTTWADGDATPDDRGGKSYRTANTSPTTITALDQGVYERDVFQIYIDDANTRINHGTGLGEIALEGGNDWISIPSGSVLSVSARNGRYKEVARMAAA